MGIIPRIFNVDHVHQLSYAELAEGLVEVDTAGWAEGWEKLSGRIKEGFETDCQRNGRNKVEATPSLSATE